MANLEVQPNWPHVRQLESYELARGGINGNMNEQAKALAERTEFLNQEKANKSEIVQGVFEFGTYAEFDVEKANLPANCTVVIGEENNSGTGNWGSGNNRWDGVDLKKSDYDPLLQANLYTSNIMTLIADIQLSELDVDKKFIESNLKVAGGIKSAGGASNSLIDATYVLNTDVSNKKIRAVVVHSNSVGAELKFKAFQKNAENFNLSRVLFKVKIQKVGLNYFIVPDYVYISENEWIGFSALAGSFTFNRTSSEFPLYYSAHSITADTVPLLNEGKTADLQIGVYESTPFSLINQKINQLEDLTIANLDEVKSIIGVVEKMYGYSNPMSGTNAGAAQWILAESVIKKGKLKEFQTFSSVSGNLTICIYRKTATYAFTPKHTEIVAVTAGLNKIKLDIDVDMGDYLGIKTTQAGMTQYTFSSTDDFPVYSHTNLESITGFAGPTSIAYWHFKFTVDEREGTPKKWAGKKYVSFGDSITWYNERNFSTSHIESGQFAKGYQSYIVDALGCTLDNKGESGWDMTQIYASRIQTYDFSDCYLTTITSGANDCRKGVPVGTLQPIGSAFNTATYAGAMQAAIEKVITSNPNTKIVLITPIRGWYTEYNTSNVPNTDPTVVGLMKREYPDMIKAIAKLYGLPVVDFYDELGWNDLNKNIYLGDDPSKFTAYLLHPNNKGYERMGEIILSVLSKL